MKTIENIKIQGTVAAVSNEEESVMKTMTNTEAMAMQDPIYDTSEEDVDTFDFTQRLDITKTSEPGYVTKAELGARLGLTKTEIKKATRDQLVERWMNSEESTEYLTDEATGQPIDRVDIPDDEAVEVEETTVEKEEEEMKTENKMGAKERKFWTLLNDEMKKQKSKGYGESVSGFMLAAIMADVFYGISNMKKALKNGQISDKIKTNVYAGMRKLMDNGYITPVVAQRTFKAMNGELIKVSYGVANTYGINLKSVILVDDLSAYVGKITTKNITMYGINKNLIHDMMVERW